MGHVLYVVSIFEGVIRGLRKALSVLMHLCNYYYCYC